MNAHNDECAGENSAFCENPDGIELFACFVDFNSSAHLIAQTPPHRRFAAEKLRSVSLLPGPKKFIHRRPADGSTEAGFDQKRANQPQVIRRAGLARDAVSASNEAEATLRCTRERKFSDASSRGDSADD